MNDKTSKMLEEAMTTFAGDKDWPERVYLYKSLEEQELLYDKAWSYTIEALLAVHELRDGYTVCRRHNSEHMAPKKGHVPFLRIQDDVIGKHDILDYLAKMDKSLFLDRNAEDDLSIKGVLAMIENKLTAIEYYITWIEESNKKQEKGTSQDIDVKNQTHKVYSHSLPTALQKILCYQKEKEVKQYLQVTGWLNKSKAELLHEANTIFNYLSKKLESSKFIAGESVSEADVYVYGHLQAIYESQLNTNFLKDTLEQYAKLADFCLHFGQVQLGKKAMIF